MIDLRVKHQKKGLVTCKEKEPVNFGDLICNYNNDRFKLYLFLVEIHFRMYKTLLSVPKFTANLYCNCLSEFETCV